MLSVLPLGSFLFFSPCVAEGVGGLLPTALVSMLLIISTSHVVSIGMDFVFFLHLNEMFKCPNVQLFSLFLIKYQQMLKYFAARKFNLLLFIEKARWSCMYTCACVRFVPLSAGP